MLKILGQGRAQLHGNLGIVFGHFQPKTAAAAVTQRSEIRPRRDRTERRIDLGLDSQRAELHKVIAGALVRAVSRRYRNGAARRGAHATAIVQNVMLTDRIPLVARANTVCSSKTCRNISRR